MPEWLVLPAMPQMLAFPAQRASDPTGCQPALRAFREAPARTSTAGTAGISSMGVNERRMFAWWVGLPAALRPWNLRAAGPRVHIVGTHVLWAPGRTLVPGDEGLPAMPGTPETLAFQAFRAFLAKQLPAHRPRVSGIASTAGNADHAGFSGLVGSPCSPSHLVILDRPERPTHRALLSFGQCGLVRCARCRQCWHFGLVLRAGPVAPP